MTRRRPRRRLGASSTGRPRRADGEVGYCRPPKEHQFKSGKSGNPKGRPKGARNEATILRGIFNRRIEVREGGRARKMSVLEAMFLRFTEDALKGNAKAAIFLLNRYRLTEGTAAEADQFDQDDREVLDAFARRLEADLKATQQKA